MAADLPETPNIQPAPREREEVPVQLSGLSIRTLSGIVVCSVAAHRCRQKIEEPICRQHVSRRPLSGLRKTIIEIEPIYLERRQQI